MSRVDEHTLMMSFQDGWSPLTFPDLATDFFAFVVVFFALGEASGEDKSDDMVILRRDRGMLDCGDGRQM